MMGIIIIRPVFERERDFGWGVLKIGLAADELNSVLLKRTEGPTTIPERIPNP
jgi:hypothetical protein